MTTSTSVERLSFPKQSMTTTTRTMAMKATGKKVVVEAAAKKPNMELKAQRKRAREPRRWKSLTKRRKNIETD